MAPTKSVAKVDVEATASSGFGAALGCVGSVPVELLLLAAAGILVAISAGMYLCGCCQHRELRPKRQKRASRLKAPEVAAEEDAEAAEPLMAPSATEAAAPISVVYTPLAPMRLVQPLYMAQPVVSAV
eukprot:CAMPEP_0180523152 /NCGR_PEP_ID=MMETSP1036_2-20121128/57846_1 /TAXON_ID=632150 /ORGANISM="Azadinium spinosum, Strain 3D9" /LENGTH=127 /DNA_ID=CAMNT_0022536093 /DNA_START=93 /DNA_END=472 /DNA_ORIENTATION=+